MAVVTGGSITAANYNNIRTTLSGVYSTEYGQTMRAVAVTGGSTFGVSNSVTSDQMRLLFLDAQSVYIHQQGATSTSVAVPPTGQTVGADVSQTFNQTTGATATPTDGGNQGHNDYDTLIVAISNFNGSVSGWPDSSFTLGSAVSSTPRTTSWGGSVDVAKSIYHVVTVTFASVNQMNYYFNAGGEIRFAASLTSGAGAKDTDWATMLTNMGTIKFDKYGITSDSGSGTGYDGLTGSYAQLYIKTGSGVYADNDYTIEGYVTGSVIRFRISFNDGDTGDQAGVPLDPQDESVGGSTNSSINTFRPDSTFTYAATSYQAVSISAPTIATVVQLTSDNVTPPA
jgi:hypothetical protein